jgi:hypothetical protein
MDTSRSAESLSKESEYDDSSYQLPINTYDTTPTFLSIQPAFTTSSTPTDPLHHTNTLYYIIINNNNNNPNNNNNSNNNSNSNNNK